MRFPIFNRTPYQPYLSKSEVDLKVFRPQPINDRCQKVIGYLPNHYVVKVSMPHDEMENDRLVKNFYRTVLEQFPKKGFLDVHVLTRNPGNHDYFDRFFFRHVCRLIRDKKDGNVRVEEISQKNDGKTSEQQLLASDYAQIEIMVHHGFRSKVMKKKSKFDRKINLNQF